MLDAFNWIIENWAYIASVALGFTVAIVIILMSIIGTIADIGSSVIKGIKQ